MSTLIHRVAHDFSLHTSDGGKKEDFTGSFRLQGCSSTPASWSEQDQHSDYVAQGFVLLGLENLQGQSLCSLSGQPAPLLYCSHSEKCFPCMRSGHPIFQFMGTVSHFSTAP